METGHNYILKIKDAPGDCDLSGYEGCILLDSWQTGYTLPIKTAGLHGTDTLEGIGKITHSGIKITKSLDLGCIILIEKLWQAQVIEDAQIFCINNNKAYLTLNLKNILISNVKVTADHGKPKLEIDISYEEVQYDYESPEITDNRPQGIKKISHNMITGESK